MLLLFQKSHFMYFEKMSVYPWWRPLHIPGWQQPGPRPRGCPDRPSKCWAPSRAGFWAVSFSKAAWSCGGTACPCRVLRAWPGKQRRAPVCAEGVACPHTCPPCHLELHLAALPQLPPACAPSGKGSSHCSLGELIAVWGFWPYLLSRTICGNLIPFFSVMGLLDNAIH